MTDSDREARAQPKILVLCTVSTGLDAVAEVLRSGYSLAGVVGLSPQDADPMKVSGWVDVASFAQKWQCPFFYVDRYDLKSDSDRALFASLDYELVWVAGWQRLVPDWLIESASLGVIGGHGSPDGIHGGRGRSPQNWALMLGCKRFDLALFRIAPGVDDGPVVAQRSFFYNETDDIGISYKKCALSMASMVLDVLEDPDLLNAATPQPTTAFYYPQRRPRDGRVDWSLTQREIHAHCRALTRPYPGLRTRRGPSEIVIWICQPFDDQIDGEPGHVSVCFEDGSFLVSCGDGRVIVVEWECLTGSCDSLTHATLESRDYRGCLNEIVSRHIERHPHYPVSQRITNRAGPSPTAAPVVTDS